jgi:site-specific DNA recombinase
MQKPSTAQISWEYLMPKPREIAARYIRESDPTMGESSTMESQAKYVSQHCQKEGYLMPPEFEFREAISGYNVSYMQRPELLRLLEAVKKGLVNVVVISEVRALSRKQVEIFVIYDLLQKYHCRLETVLEKFEDSTMGRLILSLRAAFSEIERDQIYLRLERGKKHRREDGAPNGHPKPAYGYRFYNTKYEVKAGYEFNDIIIHVDADGGEWSEHAVCLFIFALLLRRYSLKKITNKLNDLGIPPPRKATKREPHWSSSTLFRMFSNKIYIGEVWNNRFAKVDGRMVRRPESEWELVCRAPAMIDRETFDIIQRQFAFNKEEALRNNKHTDDLGLLRSGYIYCGVCGCRMSVIYPTPSMIRNHNGPFYRCYQREGGNHSLNHTTTIGLKLIDSAAWEKVLEVLRTPHLVRERVAQLRQNNEQLIDIEVVEETLASIQTQMDNLFELAKHATNKDTVSQLGLMMEELEKQRRNTQALLVDVEESKEEQEAIEVEITKFETWIENVRDLLLSDYQPTYEEMRLAIRILGLKVTVYPTTGDYAFRYAIEMMIPGIAAKIKNIALPSRYG